MEKLVQKQIAILFDSKNVEIIYMSNTSSGGTQNYKQVCSEKKRLSVIFHPYRVQICLNIIIMDYQLVTYIELGLNII